MGMITISTYPVEIGLIHNDIPIGQITDEWGTRDVFEIVQLYGKNWTDTSWTVIEADTQGHEYSYTMGPQEEGTINIVPPKRFESEPLTSHLVFVRA